MTQLGAHQLDVGTEAMRVLTRETSMCVRRDLKRYRARKATTVLARLAVRDATGHTPTRARVCWTRDFRFLSDIFDVPHVPHVTCMIGHTR